MSSADLHADWKDVLSSRDARERDRQVQRVILVEGGANLAVLGLKLVVGITTGSMGILGDAVHSVTDIANNVVAWIVVRISTRPADERHPYGHRKFETIAVFGLAMLLTILAFELGLRAVQREVVEIVHTGWAMGLMLCVLVVNFGLSTWQASWARRLGSDILRADSRHTFADVLTTLVVIAGWQAAARGFPWFDTIAALGVSVVILFLAFGLFRRAIPILVDESTLDSHRLVDLAMSVPGVMGVRRVRSRGGDTHASVDLVALVPADLSTAESHDIATRIERSIRSAFPVESVVVHIEPLEANERARGTVR
jgi:cation diffusion facilitator family transporter